MFTYRYCIFIIPKNTYRHLHAYMLHLLYVRVFPCHATSLTLCDCSHGGDQSTARKHVAVKYIQYAYFCYISSIISFAIHSLIHVRIQYCLIQVHARMRHSSRISKVQVQHTRAVYPAPPVYLHEAHTLQPQHAQYARAMYIHRTPLVS